MSDNFFKKMMRKQGVTPLKTTDRQYFKSNTIKSSAKPILIKSNTNDGGQNRFSDMLCGDKVDGKAVLDFHQSGIQPKTLKNLKQGKLSIAGHFDLHGLTVEKARNETFLFLREAYQNNDRCVLLIHGKSSKNGTHSILKSYLNSWLKRCDFILAFHSAQNKHGGTGAIYVLLKKC